MALITSKVWIRFTIGLKPATIGQMRLDRYSFIGNRTLRPMMPVGRSTTTCKRGWSIIARHCMSASTRSLIQPWVRCAKLRSERSSSNTGLWGLIL